MNEMEESVRYVKSKVSLRPKTAVVLGSGLGDFASRLTNKKIIDGADIPNYPTSGVEGHAGKLVFGRVPIKRPRVGTAVLAFLGRSHFYESGDLGRVTFAVRLAHRLGIRNLILTNAAGGIKSSFSPGDLMAITDHINMTFNSIRFDYGSHRSKSFELRPTRKQSSPYDSLLLKLVKRAATENGIPLKQGVYCGVNGPSYETAAEINMIRRIGGDAVGMSTIHEATAASNLGMRVLGISLITNLATGLAAQPATHVEVIKVAREARKKFEALLISVLSLLPTS